MLEGMASRALAVVLGSSFVSIAVACGSAYDGRDPIEVLPAGDASAVTDGGRGTSGDAARADTDAGARAADAGPSWLLFAYFEQTQAWGDAVPLEQYFGTSPNAPPPRGIKAATFVAPLAQLLVVDATGTFYVRKGPSWSTPRPAKEAFPTFGAALPNSLYYLPQSDGGTAQVGLTFTSGNKAYLFEYTAAGQITPSGTPLTLQDQPGGAPQGTVPARWDYEVFDVSKYGKDPAWAYLYAGYGEDVWRFDGAFVWVKYAGAQFPAFARPGAPPRDRIREAFRSDGERIVYFVVEP